jgi:hypothetical protein
VVGDVTKHAVPYHFHFSFEERNSFVSKNFNGYFTGCLPLQVPVKSMEMTSFTIPCFAFYE